jgi:glycosyltransferase involved in cell wall biosynthesis
MTMCEASVVVATRQRAALLPELARALLSQTGLSTFEVILVDDGSTDETTAVLRDLAHADARIRTESLPERRGPAAARNRGLRLATGPIVAFTDDDCLPQPNWLSGLVAAHREGFDVVQGRTEARTPDAERGTYSNVVEIRSFSHLYQTCNMSYRREVLERHGGFDEMFGFSAGGAPNGEDADLGWRAAEAGARETFAADAVVVHPVVPRSFRQAFVARLRAFRMVYFVRRHPGFRQYAVARFFFQRSHPYALVSLAGLVPLLVTWSAPALAVAGAGLVPYAFYRWRVSRLIGRRRLQPLLVAGAWLIDCAEVIVMLTASVRWRTLFL